MTFGITFFIIELLKNTLTINLIKINWKIKVQLKSIILGKVEFQLKFIHFSKYSMLIIKPYLIQFTIKSLFISLITVNFYQ